MISPFVYEISIYICQNSSNLENMSIDGGVVERPSGEVNQPVQNLIPDSIFPSDVSIHFIFFFVCENYKLSDHSISFYI